MKSEYDVGYLKELITLRDPAALKVFMTEHDLVVCNHKIVPRHIKPYRDQEQHYNFRQHAKKIMLNSLYGALLNAGCRFYDSRIGQSVTLTGRSIVRHMNAKINEIITGIYDYVGEAIVYSDTDSSYFTAVHLLRVQPAYNDFSWTRDNIVLVYDAIAEAVNESFPTFMTEHFNTGPERGGIIRASRELVAGKGYFTKKKKYAVLMYDKEGKRLDGDGVGKLKIMGLDLKRSDTPKYMQTFMEKLLLALLTGSKKDELFVMIKEFRRWFVKLPGWEKGTPKKVNSLIDYRNKLDKMAIPTIASLNSMNTKTKTKLNIPGHVTAALNWNKLRESNNDNYAMEITDGGKIIVCKLRPNFLKMTSVALPTDEMHIPQWFKNLPFDHEEMENVIIDNKLDNLLGVMNWDLSETKESSNDDIFSFAADKNSILS